MRRNYPVINAVICVFFLLAGCQQQAKVMSPEDGHIKLLSQKKLGDRYRLALEITPPGEDKKKFTDAFTVNMEDGDTLEVTCQGLYKKAEQAAAPEAVAQKGEPNIEFESLVYDFGKVGPRKKLLGEFKFTNTGDAPLKITKVERCCGVVTQLGKAEYEPGESGVLKLRYTSSLNPNKIKKQLYINCNDKGNPRVTLTMQVETVLNVTYEPRSLRLSLEEENAGCPPITIKSVDNQPFSITGFESTGGGLTAEFDSSVEGTQFVLQPKAHMENLPKGRSGMVNINLSFPEVDTPPEKVTIYFRTLSRFSLKPSVLMFFYTKSREPIKRNLWVISNSTEDFEIESTSSKDGHIKVLNKKKVGQRYQLELEITPPPDEKIWRFSDEFIVNIKGGEQIKLACRGIYRAPKPFKAGE